MDDQITDDALLEAIRRRAAMLRELQHEIGGTGGGGASHIENNVYGGGLGGGVSGQLGGSAGEMSPEERDYFVEIARRNVTDPESGELIGWDKNVHRYTQPRIPSAHFKKKAP